MNTFLLGLGAAIVICCVILLLFGRKLWRWNERVSEKLVGANNTVRMPPFINYVYVGLLIVGVVLVMASFVK